MIEHKCRKGPEEIKRMKMIFGLFVAVLGGLLLIKNIGLVPEPYSQYVFSWQSLLIYIGIFSSLKHRKIHFGSIVLILVGLFFILKNIYLIPNFAPHIIGPLLLVFLGLAIIFKKIKKPAFNNFCESSESEDNFEDIRVFGGGKIIIDSQQFKGGKSITIFGGNEINLTMAKLAEGVQVIEMFAIFGGSEIIVPVDWNIKVEVVGIFGGFNDKRTIHPNLNINRDKTLIIRGFAIFGGGEIKSGH